MTLASGAAAASRVRDAKRATGRRTGDLSCKRWLGGETCGLTRGAAGCREAEVESMGSSSWQK